MDIRETVLEMAKKRPGGFAQALQSLEFGQGRVLLELADQLMLTQIIFSRRTRKT